MRKWLRIVLLVGISGVLLAFLLAQMLPHWRSTSSGIVVDVDDPALVERMLAKLHMLVRQELGEDSAPPWDMDMFGTREVTYRKATAGTD